MRLGGGRVPVEHSSAAVTGPVEAGDDTPVLLEMIAVMKTLAAKVTAVHGAARILTNLGRYQDSKHLHFHINSGEPLR